VPPCRASPSSPQVEQLLFGYLFFGEVIGPLTITGAAIIIGAGLFIFMREQQLRRTAG
jgi:S-adenosylmethionine uptake transporter